MPFSLKSWLKFKKSKKKNNKVLNDCIRPFSDITTSVRIDNAVSIEESKSIKDNFTDDISEKQSEVTPNHSSTKPEELAFKKKILNNSIDSDSLKSRTKYSEVDCTDSEIRNYIFSSKSDVNCSFISHTQKTHSRNNISDDISKHKNVTESAGNDISVSTEESRSLKYKSTDDSPEKQSQVIPYHCNAKQIKLSLDKTLKSPTEHVDLKSHVQYSDIDSTYSNIRNCVIARKSDSAEEKQWEKDDSKGDITEMISQHNITYSNTEKGEFLLNNIMKNFLDNDSLKSDIKDYSIDNNFSTVANLANCVIVRKSDTIEDEKFIKVNSTNDISKKQSQLHIIPLNIKVDELSRNNMLKIFVDSDSLESHAESSEVNCTCSEIKKIAADTKSESVEKIGSIKNSSINPIIVKQSQVNLVHLNTKLDELSTNEIPNKLENSGYLNSEAECFEVYLTNSKLIILAIASKLERNYFLLQNQRTYSCSNTLDLTPFEVSIMNDLFNAHGKKNLSTKKPGISNDNFVKNKKIVIYRLENENDTLRCDQENKVTIKLEPETNFVNKKNDYKVVTLISTKETNSKKENNADYIVEEQSQFNFIQSSTKLDIVPINKILKNPEECDCLKSINECSKTDCTLSKLINCLHDNKSVANYTFRPQWQKMYSCNNSSFRSYLSGAIFEDLSNKNKISIVYDKEKLFSKEYRRSSTNPENNKAFIYRLGNETKMLRCEQKEKHVVKSSSKINKKVEDNFKISKVISTEETRSINDKNTNYIFKKTFHVNFNHSNTKLGELSIYEMSVIPEEFDSLKYHKQCAEADFIHSEPKDCVTDSKSDSNYSLISQRLKMHSCNNTSDAISQDTSTANNMFFVHRKKNLSRTDHENSNIHYKNNKTFFYCLEDEADILQCEQEEKFAFKSKTEPNFVNENDNLRISNFISADGMSSIQNNNFDHSFVKQSKVNLTPLNTKLDEQSVNKTPENPKEDDCLKSHTERSKVHSTDSELKSYVSESTFDVDYPFILQSRKIYSYSITSDEIPKDVTPINNLFDTFGKKHLSSKELLNSNIKSENNKTFIYSLEDKEENFRRKQAEKIKFELAPEINLINIKNFKAAEDFETGQKSKNNFLQSNIVKITKQGLNVCDVQKINFVTAICLKSSGDVPDSHVGNMQHYVAQICNIIQHEIHKFDQRIEKSFIRNIIFGIENSTEIFHFDDKSIDDFYKVSSNSFKTHLNNSSDWKIAKPSLRNFYFVTDARRNNLSLVEEIDENFQEDKCSDTFSKDSSNFSQTHSDHINDLASDRKIRKTELTDFNILNYGAGVQRKDASLSEKRNVIFQIDKNNDDFYKHDNYCSQLHLDRLNELFSYEKIRKTALTNFHISNSFADVQRNDPSLSEEYNVILHVQKYNDEFYKGDNNCSQIYLDHFNDLISYEKIRNPSLTCIHNLNSTGDTRIKDHSLNVKCSKIIQDDRCIDEFYKDENEFSPLHSDHFNYFRSGWKIKNTALKNFHNLNSVAEIQRMDPSVSEDINVKFEDSADSLFVNVEYKQNQSVISVDALDMCNTKQSSASIKSDETVSTYSSKEDISFLRKISSEEYSNVDFQAMNMQCKESIQNKCEDFQFRIQNNGKSLNNKCSYTSITAFYTPSPLYLNNDSLQDFRKQQTKESLQSGKQENNFLLKECSNEFWSNTLHKSILSFENDLRTKSVDELNLSKCSISWESNVSENEAAKENKLKKESNGSSINIGNEGSGDEKNYSDEIKILPSFNKNRVFPDMSAKLKNTFTISKERLPKEHNKHKIDTRNNDNISQKFKSKRAKNSPLYKNNEYIKMYTNCSFKKGDVRKNSSNIQTVFKFDQKEQPKIHVESSHAQNKDPQKGTSVISDCLCKADKDTFAQNNEWCTNCSLKRNGVRKCSPNVQIFSKFHYERSPNKCEKSSPVQLKDTEHGTSVLPNCLRLPDIDTFTKDSEIMTPIGKKILNASRAIRLPYYASPCRNKQIDKNTHKSVLMQSTKQKVPARLMSSDINFHTVEDASKILSPESKNAKVDFPRKSLTDEGNCQQIQHKMNYRALSPADLKAKFDIVFKRYAGKGRSNKDIIFYQRSTELLRDAGVIGKKLTSNEANDFFKSVAGAKVALNKDDYRHFLKKLTIKKRLNYNEVYEKICNVSERGLV